MANNFIEVPRPGSGGGGSVDNPMTTNLDAGNNAITNLSGLSLANSGDVITLGNDGQQDVGLYFNSGTGFLIIESTTAQLAGKGGASGLFLQSDELGGSVAYLNGPDIKMYSTYPTETARVTVNGIEMQNGFGIATDSLTNNATTLDQIILLGSGTVTFRADNQTEEQMQLDSSTAAGETRMLLYDVDSGLLQRVTVGAADSGGVGFKVLRIPN